METETPQTAKGILVSAESTTSYSSFNLPEITSKDILVKIHSAPINPSDIMFSIGYYPAGKTFPVAIGFEGSGLVVAAGDDPKSQALLNKKVCFFATGTPETPGSWAEYTVIQNSKAMPLPEGLDYESGAACLVNPLTVEGFVIHCKKHEYTSIVHSAAASSLGKMLVRACKEAGITLVNVVRRQEQVDMLKGLGAEHVVNTSEDDWKEKAKALFTELKVQAYFDPIAGPMAGQIIQLMPNDTTTYNYGDLTYKPIEVDPKDMMFKGKIVTGYWLSKEIQDEKTAAGMFEGAWKSLSTGLYKTEVAAKFTHDQYEEALEFYKNNASKGKVLLQNGNF